MSTTRTGDCGTPWTPRSVGFAAALVALTVGCAASGASSPDKPPRDVKTFTVLMPGSGDSVECVAWPDAHTAPSLWCQVYKDGSR